jgi:hypothetical protein
MNHLNRVHTPHSITASFLELVEHSPHQLPHYCFLPWTIWIESTPNAPLLLPAMNKLNRVHSPHSITASCRELVEHSPHPLPHYCFLPWTSWTDSTLPTHYCLLSWTIWTQSTPTAPLLLPVMNYLNTVHTHCPIAASCHEPVEQSPQSPLHHWFLSWTSWTQSAAPAPLLLPVMK